MRQNNKGFQKRVKREIKKSMLQITSGLSLLLYKGASMLNSGVVADSQAVRVEGLFKGWLNNRMAVLLMYVQSRKTRDPRCIDRVIFFLEDLRHHYMPVNIDDSVTEAFDYMHNYFMDYPAVSQDQSDKAIEMINRIYVALGYDNRIKQVKRVKEKEGVALPVRPLLDFQNIVVA